MKKILVFLFILCIISLPCYAKKQTKKFMNKPMQIERSKPQLINTKPTIDPAVLLDHQRVYDKPAVEVVTHEVDELPYLPPFPFFKLSDKSLSNIPTKKYRWGKK